MRSGEPIWDRSNKLVLDAVDVRDIFGKAGPNKPRKCRSPQCRFNLGLQPDLLVLALPLGRKRYLDPILLSVFAPTVPGRSCAHPAVSAAPSVDGDSAGESSSEPS
jgi:hypothetical protein